LKATKSLSEEAETQIFVILMWLISS
jgi:hypothetical protein